MEVFKKKTANYTAVVTVRFDNEHREYCDDLFIEVFNNAGCAIIDIIACGNGIGGGAIVIRDGDEDTECIYESKHSLYCMFQSQCKRLNMCRESTKKELCEKFSHICNMTFDLD